MEFIGIIGAMEEEVLALKNKMDVQEVRSIASLDFVIGFLNGKKRWLFVLESEKLMQQCVHKY